MTVAICIYFWINLIVWLQISSKSSKIMIGKAQAIKESGR
jgi:hypothetical protein